MSKIFSKLNCLQIEGVLGAEPKFKTYNNNGKDNLTATFSIAHHVKTKNQETQKYDTISHWFFCRITNNYDSTLLQKSIQEKWIKPGDLLRIQGTIRTFIQKTESGEEYTAFGINVQDFALSQSKKDKASDIPHQKAPETISTEDIIDDDIPF